MRIAHSLPVLVLAVVAGPGCFLFGSKVTPEDCDKWGEQYEKVLLDQGGAKIEKCQKGDGLKKAKKQLKKNIEQTKDPLITTCKGMAGTLPKASKDVDCYMAGKTADDWAKCNFAATSPLFVFGGTPDASKAQWAGLCAGGSGDASDDDDDEKPSKKKDDKKKKKGDDDDDDDKGGW